MKIKISPAVLKSYVGKGTPADIAYVIANVKAELAHSAAVKNTTVLSPTEYAKHNATLTALLTALEAVAV